MKWGKRHQVATEIIFRIRFYTGDLFVDNLCVPRGFCESFPSVLSVKRTMVGILNFTVFYVGIFKNC